MRSYRDSESKRVIQIEDKSRTTVFAVSLSVIFTSSGILVLANPDVFKSSLDIWQHLAKIIFFLSIIFFLASGYCALLGYKTGQFYTESLGEMALTEDVIDKKKRLIKGIEINQYRILQKSNLLSASIACIRNALMMLAIYVGIAVFHP